jgi:AbrB family looped-hinge helix DNA binding protein
MVHFVRLVKSGNSLGVVLPAPVREALHLGRGDQLALTIEGERLILVKLDDRRAAELVAELKGATS